MTLKLKTRLLLTGIVFGIYVAWKFAISNTIGLVDECEQFQQQLDSASTTPGKEAELKKELIDLDMQAGDRDSSAQLHEQLIGQVSSFCAAHHLLLREFTKPMMISGRGYRLQTHPFTIEGEFAPSLSLLHELEQRKSGKVVSVSFYAVTDNRTNTRSLYSTIYMQNLMRNDK